RSRAPPPAAAAGASGRRTPSRPRRGTESRTRSRTLREESSAAAPRFPPDQPRGQPGSTTQLLFCSVHLALVGVVIVPQQVQEAMESEDAELDPEGMAHLTGL